MVWKLGKVFCCILLFAILGVDPAQNLEKIQKVVMCAHATNQEKHYDYVIHTYSIRIKQKMCRVSELPTKILACLFASLMFTGLPNHFPLLTMC